MLRDTLETDLSAWEAIDESHQRAQDDFQARINQLRTGPARDPEEALQRRFAIYPQPSPAVREPMIAPNRVTQERLEFLRRDDNYLNLTDEELGLALVLDADTVKKLRLKYGLRKRKPRKRISKQST